MNYTRILYFTKGLGKYKILIPCEGKNYFPLRPKGLKNTFPCGLRPLGNVFLTFGPLGEVIFTLTRDEYFILPRPLGEVYHIPMYYITVIRNILCFLETFEKCLPKSWTMFQQVQIHWFDMRRNLWFEKILLRQIQLRGWLWLPWWNFLSRKFERKILFR